MFGEIISKFCYFDLTKIILKQIKNIGSKINIIIFMILYISYTKIIL